MLFSTYLLSLSAIQGSLALAHMVLPRDSAATVGSHSLKFTRPDGSVFSASSLTLDTCYDTPEGFGKTGQRIQVDTKDEIVFQVFSDKGCNTGLISYDNKAWTQSGGGIHWFSDSGTLPVDTRSFGIKCKTGSVLVNGQCSMASQTATASSTHTN